MFIISGVKEMIDDIPSQRTPNMKIRFNFPKCYPIAYLYRDFLNLIKYRIKAPKSAERIYVNPNQCVISPKLTELWYNKNVSGMVLKEWPDFEITPIINQQKITICIAHWVNGIDWENTGAYELLMDIIDEEGEFDGCVTKNQVKKRYAILDEIFNEVKQTGHFKTRKELNKRNFRETGAPIVHVGPNGQLFFSEKGNHRFSIGLIQDIKIPVKIGAVHITALPLLNQLRKKNVTTNDNQT